MHTPSEGWGRSGRAGDAPPRRMCSCWWMPCRRSSPRAWYFAASWTSSSTAGCPGSAPVVSALRCRSSRAMNPSPLRGSSVRAYRTRPPAGTAAVAAGHRYRSTRTGRPASSTQIARYAPPAGALRGFGRVYSTVPGTGSTATGSARTAEGVVASTSTTRSTSLYPSPGPCPSDPAATPPATNVCRVSSSVTAASHISRSRATAAIAAPSYTDRG